MNIIPPPPLPFLRMMPAYIAIDGLIGYGIGQLNQLNSNLIALIFIVRSLAETLLYHLANYVLGGKNLSSQKIFLVSSTVVNMAFLITLREINVIGRLFSCLLGLAIIGHLIDRVKYIQAQDRQMILEEDIELGVTN